MDRKKEDSSRWEKKKNTSRREREDMGRGESNREERERERLVQRERENLLVPLHSRLYLVREISLHQRLQLLLVSEYRRDEAQRVVLRDRSERAVAHKGWGE